VQVQFKVYVGPKEVERLAVLGNGLEEAVDLGMFGLFSKVLLFFLGIFHAGVGNWGVAILLLTLLVRIVFYPLTASAFRAGKVMQALQPKIKELQERHGEDKETLNREMLKLFAKHKANPLGGCLPMLVQMPIFFALYNGLMHTPDLYHAEFLFVRDLSAPDPWGVFPGLMAVGMVLQQRLTPMTGMDPDQARMMKFMPLIFALFMFSVPAGLSVYYATNTLLSIAQQWYNTRNFQPTVLDDEA
jgi:YidC/Oxa1 family membrane protein insertase